MSGSLNFTQFLILLWMIKEACPIITNEKLTQPSVWTNWGSFVCFAVSQCRNLMFSPLRLGSCFPSLDQYFLWLKLVTSGWPSAPHMTSLTPAVSRCWSKALCTIDRLHWLQGKQCSVTKYVTGANWANTTAVIYREALVWLFNIIFMSRREVKWDLVTMSLFCVAPPLNSGNWNLHLISWLLASVASSANQCCNDCCLKTQKKEKKKKIKSPK